MDIEHACLKFPSSSKELARVLAGLVLTELGKRLASCWPEPAPKGRVAPKDSAQVPKAAGIVFALMLLRGRMTCTEGVLASGINPELVMSAVVSILLNLLILKSSRFLPEFAASPE